MLWDHEASASEVLLLIKRTNTYSWDLVFHTATLATSEFSDVCCRDRADDPNLIRQCRFRENSCTSSRLHGTAQMVQKLRRFLEMWSKVNYWPLRCCPPLTFCDNESGKFMNYQLERSNSHATPS
jgi:hypothetical protein